MSELETLRQINSKSKELEEAQAKLIQDLSAEVEELQRDLAQAQMRIEEVEAERDAATEQMEER